jgi:uncharacterized membrane protein YphA (DoxX/SURF4 family)
MRNLMTQLYCPNLDIPTRLRAVKTWLILGLLLCMVPSWRLWFPYERVFPLVPLVNVFEDKLPLLSMALSSVFVLVGLSCLFIRKPRYCIPILFIISLLMLAIDQTRLQPWFYQFSILLFLLSLYNWRVDEPRDYTGIFMNIRIVIAFVYIWSGIQKFNIHFFEKVWPWMITPFESICTPEQISYLTKFGYVIPAFELVAGVLLFFGVTRKVALPFLILMHTLILILIGPTLKNHNPSVWGWNLSMIFLLYFSFAGKADLKSYHPAYLLQKISFYIIIFAVGIMPFFNLINKWDSYLSANLYSGNTSNGVVYINEIAKKKLPFYLQYFSHPEGTDRYSINVKTWAMHELGVPGYPEKRIYEAVEKHLKKITCCDEHIVLHYENKAEIFAFANK